MFVHFRFIILYMILFSILFGYSIETKVNNKIISMGDPVIYKIGFISKKPMLFERFDIEHNKSVVLEQSKIFFEHDLNTDTWHYFSILMFTYFNLGDFDLPKVFVDGYIESVEDNEKFTEVIKPIKINVKGFEIEDYHKIRPSTDIEKFRFNFILLIILLSLLLFIVSSIGFIVFFFRKRKHSIEDSDIDLRFAIKNMIIQLKIRWQKNSLEVEKTLDELDFHFREFLKYEYKYISLEQVHENFVVNFIYQKTFYFSDDLKKSIKLFFTQGENYRFSPSLLMKEPDKLEYFFQEVQNLLELIENERSLKEKNGIETENGI